MRICCIENNPNTAGPRMRATIRLDGDVSPTCATYIDHAYNIPQEQATPRYQHPTDWDINTLTDRHI